MMTAYAGKQTPEEAKVTPDGPALFASQCAACHGDEGKGAREGYRWHRHESQ